METHINSSQSQEYEETLQEGISAAKAGRRVQARKLLERAASLNAFDSHPWIWLSSTTDDPAEQRKYLEYAVAADPSNATARRGLVLLSDQLDKARLMPEGEGLASNPPAEPQEARAAQSFSCPQCGGRMSFDPAQHCLVCESCGHSQASGAGQAADAVEKPLDFILPTTRAHRWAEAQHAMKCEQCGALTLLPPGEKTLRCPYCASNQMIESAETVELVDPQAIGLMKFDQKSAMRHVKRWLGSGWFVPDDLVKAVRRLQLRPAYYPFWTLDGTLEVTWSCQVNEDSGRSSSWVTRTGTEFELFDDVLVPGLRALPSEQLAGIEPFNLKDLLEFRPEHLAGWLALAYDCPLADAALLARQKVIGKLRRALPDRIEPGRQKRNITSGAGKWSGLTYKHILLPLWVGAYQYRGKIYQLLVNGQTGKVGGVKPRDTSKVILLAVILLLTLAVIILGGIMLMR